MNDSHINSYCTEVIVVIFWFSSLRANIQVPSPFLLESNQPVSGPTQSCMAALCKLERDAPFSRQLPLRTRLCGLGSKVHAVLRLRLFPPWLGALVQGITCIVVCGIIDHHCPRHCTMNQFRLVKYKDILIEALRNKNSLSSMEVANKDTLSQWV